MEIIAAAVVLVAAGSAVGLYNRLVRARVRAEEAWSQIDIQLQRRHGLIPNLVETVRGYAEHEKETFDQVIRARAAAISISEPSELARAEEGLMQAVGRLLAIAENYPQLKADAGFLSLQDELSRTEDMVAGARSYYNAAVRSYETLRQTFPSSLAAAAFSFRPRGYFEIDSSAARTAPEIGI